MILDIDNFLNIRVKKQFLYWKNKYTRDRTCSLKLETYEDKIV